MRRSLRVLATDRRGIALVTILALMRVLSVLAATYTLAIRADTALRGGAARGRTSFYAAGAGLNNAMGKSTSILRTIPPQETIVIQLWSVPVRMHVP
jgi:type II secretory pathway component PulK